MYSLTGLSEVLSAFAGLGGVLSDLLLDDMVVAVVLFVLLLLVAL